MRNARQLKGKKVCSSSPSFPPERQTIESRLDLAARLWGWQPHPGQREFLTLRLADGSEPKTLVAACGRRWGKTEALSVDIATRLLTIPDEAQLLVGPTRDQADGLFDAIEEKLREVLNGEETVKEFPHITDFEFKRSPYPHIRRKSDGQMLLSSRSAGRNGRSLRGKGTTRKMRKFRVTVDEAAFVPDKAITEALQPMLATVPGGGQLVMISSPYGKRGVFYSSYLKGEQKQGRYRAVRLPSAQNPIVDREFLAEKEAELPPRQFAAEYLAEFVDSGGAVFPSEDIEACTVEDDYGRGPLAGVVYVAGVDLARRGDFTVVTVGAVEGDRLRLVAIHRFTGLGWRKQIDDVCDVLQFWGVRRVCPDRSGIGDMPVETLQGEIIARRMRCELVEFVFTETGKRHIVDGLAICLSKQRIAFPPHPVLLSELANFEVVSLTSSGRERMEARIGHDDTVMSLGLMVEAAAPFWSRPGGVVGSTAGQRVIGATASAKDADFSLCEHLTLIELGASSIDSYQNPTRWHRLLWQVLGVVCRFGAGRAVLAWLHHRFSRRTSG
jgi:hypothetical protein